MARSDDWAEVERRALSLPDLGQSEELRVPKTAELVADRIRKRIISGELAEGASLPPEGQLMESFGISRPTLREAFRILEAERLISVSRGSRSGARVSLPQVSGVSRYASFVLQANAVTVPDIFEARLALELFAVRRLSNRGGKAAMKLLRSEVDRLEALDRGGDTRGFIAALTEFHEHLVEQGGNRTLHFMIQMLHELLDEVKLRLIRRDAEGRVADSATALKSLRKLLDLIEAGEGEAAARHWRLHLVNANKSWAYDGSLREILAD
ncbi:MAG: FadR/GntR family transcriptional regulator [Erythrobacter sp.]